MKLENFKLLNEQWTKWTKLNEQTADQSAVQQAMTQAIDELPDRAEEPKESGEGMAVGQTPEETTRARGTKQDPHGLNPLVNDISGFVLTLLNWNPTKANNVDAVNDTFVQLNDRLDTLKSKVADLSRGQPALERIPNLER